MVSVVHSVAAQSDIDKSLPVLAEGLGPQDAARVGEVVAFIREAYDARKLGSGEDALQHALGMGLIAAGLNLDRDARLAALLFAVPQFDEAAGEKLAAQYGENVALLVRGLARLNLLRPITRHSVVDPASSPQEMQAQIEILRKMLLAMVEDIRVVLLSLASRTQTLRHYAEHDEERAMRAQVAHETLEIYSPLANRLGVWELKWEMEDISFRFLHPDIYTRIARQLDEKRVEREKFIAEAIALVRHELEALGIKAEIYGRPKHIYSIWNKMRRKGVEFSEVHDVRALRVIVDELKDCYTVLGIVHHLWAPIAAEFDDYISHPKGNNYQSLHTAVRCIDGRSLEIQIRTGDMHRHAELGVAAHWRYKEGAKGGAAGGYDDKIAMLRQILAWRDDTGESTDWVAHYKQAALDETIYLLTPQGKVIDLPKGATPIDFAYRLHSELGHRCRGAKVNGQLVPLNTPLQTAQRVEIVAAKQGGPSRDWLNPVLGFLVTKSARHKVRQWFASLAQEDLVAEGRNILGRELQRLGQTNANIDALASKLGFARSEDFFPAIARADISTYQIQAALRNEVPPPEVDDPGKAIRRSKVSKDGQGVLIVGVDKLLTQLARCCKPAPPENIRGFVTRGKGVSIHRIDCRTFAQMAAFHPERVIEAGWGSLVGGVFSVDVVVEARDRQGLLRDITDILAREKVNVTAVRTQSKQGRAYMGFTVEVEDLSRLQRVLGMVRDIDGVEVARRS